MQAVEIQKGICTLSVSRILFLLLSCFLGNTSSAQDIDWEIAGNRFSPFATLEKPKEVFQFWALSSGEDLTQWHKRVWEDKPDGSFTSPYGSALSNISDNNQAPWDQARKRHRDGVLTYVQDKTALIAVRVWSDFNGPCTWSFESQETPPVSVTSCTEKVDLEIPMSGMSVTLRANGQALPRKLEPDHVVIVAMGDSYASGEGNPDVPARWREWGTTAGSIDPPTEGTVNWLRDQNLTQNSAKWLAPTCRRSFFSNQSLAALAYASAHRQRYVTFLHYSCSGAEIFDGLLAPQRRSLKEAQDNLPGNLRSFQLRSQIDSAILELCASTPRREDFSESVLEGAVGEGSRPRFRRQYGFDGLIDGQLEEPFYEDARKRNHEEIRDLASDAQPAEDIDGPYGGLLACPPDHLAVPDIVLVGVGGNDIGFQGVVSYYVTPVNFIARLSSVGHGLNWSGLALLGLAPEVCPGENNQVELKRESRRLHRYCNGRRRLSDWEADFFPQLSGTWTIDPITSSDLVDGQFTGTRDRTRCADGFCRGIVARYGVLVDALTNSLGVPTRRIVMPTYPDPLRTEEETTSSPCSPLPVDAVRGLSRGQVDGEHDESGPFNAMPAIVYSRTARKFFPNFGERVWEDWEFNLTGGPWRETAVLLRQFEKQRQAMLDAQKKYGFQLACEARDAFLGHHFMDGKQLALPNATRGGYAGPHLWRPYRYSSAPERAIRTGNDSFLTQFGGVDGDGELDDVADFHGTAHPNLTGHREVAKTLLPYMEKAASYSE